MLFTAADSSLFPTLLPRGVRARATVKVPGRSFSADSHSLSSICKAENGERPKKSLEHHNDDNNNPQFPRSQSHLTPPFISSPEILFPQDCWHPEEDRSSTGVVLEVREVAWDGMEWDVGFFQDSEFTSWSARGFFHGTLSLPFKLLSASISQQLNGVGLFSFAVWIVSSLKQRQFHLLACLLLAVAAAMISFVMRE